MLDIFQMQCQNMPGENGNESERNFWISEEFAAMIFYSEN